MCIGEVWTAEHLLSALEGLGVGNVGVQVDCLEARGRGSRCHVA